MQDAAGDGRFAGPKSKIQNLKSKIGVSFADAGAAVPIDQSAALLTKKLVHDDETVILLLRPSLSYVALSSLGGLSFIALVTFVLAYVAKFMSNLPGIGWSDRQAFGLGLGLAALRLGWALLEWLGKAYVLTDRRIITRSGVLRIAVSETPLRSIQHTSVFASLRERVSGLGTIGFASTGSETFDAFWQMVRRPFDVHRTVVETIRRYGR